MEKWIERAFIKMRRHKIKQIDVAKKYGCAREHINRILNGAFKPTKGAEERIMAAIDEIIAERKKEK